MSGRSAHFVHAESVNSAVTTIAAMDFKGELIVVPLQLCTKNCHGWAATVENRPFHKRALFLRPFFGMMSAMAMLVRREKPA